MPCEVWAEQGRRGLRESVAKPHATVNQASRELRHVCGGGGPEIAHQPGMGFSSQPGVCQPTPLLCSLPVLAMLLQRAW